ncbi:MAG: fatty acid desaturase [Chloroflexota bacterium]
MSVGTDFEKLNWQKLVAAYARPDLRRSLWQVANTLLPYFALWAMMLWSLQVSYWLTLALAIPAAGFMMRGFIIFHDCCHGSFFKSRKANDSLGFFLGVLMLTPYAQWRHDHAVHHATAGNLDRRGVGDVFTLTVQEYLASPWWKRAGYRIMRHPLFLLTIGATFVFVVSHRFWTPKAGREERLSVVYTNLALAAIVAGMSWLVGLKAFLLVFTPIIVLACGVGVWLFYVQHQFEEAYWERKENWSFVRAGLQGSSFYKLPAVLQWFSGNIGFHHIHHLSPKIPNYNLPKCHRENAAFQVRPLTLWSSLKSMRLHLWDETARRLVGFDALRRYKSQALQS